MNYFKTILEAIGNTPLIKLNSVTKGVVSPIYAKVEYLNPGGSVKDRIALKLVEDGEESGKLKPGGTIIEPTSGNTGVGLAIVAAIKGYRCIFVMPDKVSQDKRDLLTAYGAEVVVTPTDVAPDSPNQYVNVAKRLNHEIPNSFWPDQYNNLKNPESHYESTGPEIWEQTNGKIDVFVCGMGTGGTISGVGKYLKEKNPKLTVVGIDPEGSIYSGDNPRSYLVEGIGEDFLPKTFDRRIVDEMVRISDRESFHITRQLAREEGLLVGGSSGTAVAGAIQYARRLKESKNIVVLLPDSGRNYLSKIFSDDWMRANGFLDYQSEKATVRDLLKKRQKKSTPVLISLKPTDTIAQAITLMQTHQISQLPVIDGSRNVGSIKEEILINAFHGGTNVSHQVVETVMGKALPEITIDMNITEAYRLLRAGHTGIVVFDHKKPVAVISSMDLIDFWVNN